MPWVTRWTGERAASGMVGLVLDPPTGRTRARYADHSPGGEQFGVVWFRDGHAPGVGEPAFASVHSVRQRACMTVPRCQVCGVRLPTGRTPWLLTIRELTAVRAGELTGTPPICQACSPIAARLCPFLRSRRLATVLVGGIDPAAVAAHVWSPGTRPGVPAAPVATRVVPLDHAGAQVCVAKQLLVALREVTVLDTAP